MRHSFRILLAATAGLLLAARVVAAEPVTGRPVPGNPKFPAIPAEYLIEREDIPAFWISDVEGVQRFLREKVKKGKVETIGHTAGGRPILAATYGTPRQGKGTSTFSGSLGFFDVRAYLGPDADKKVFVALGAVHGGEFEGIVGVVNLISILETGRDLRGKEWPEITAAAAKLDRIVLVPIVNVDGRARIPVKMEPWAGSDKRFHEYFNTGCWADGKHIGWPTVKEFIPLDFARTQFPGGYPNDAGVNIQHDDFLGARQPETQALLDLGARERPDLLFNMHTGAPPENYYVRAHRPSVEQKLGPVFDQLYTTIHTALALAGLQYTRDPKIEAKPSKRANGPMNLETAMNLHCGVLPVLIEAPSHSFAGRNPKGEPAPHTPDMLVDAQLICHQAGMSFLAEHGGRVKWAAK